MVEVESQPDRGVLSLLVVLMEMTLMELAMAISDMEGMLLTMVQEVGEDITEEEELDPMISR